jgi:carotenoid cleavage dioxygenase-like enzyme
MDHNNTEVPPKSEFSFLASKPTASQSIRVMIKDQRVPVTVTTVSNGYLVKGKLPDTVKGTYIRVEIFANGPNQCDRTDGWLLKIGK